MEKTEQEKDNKIKKLKEENLLLKRALEAVIKEYLNMSTTYRNNFLWQTTPLQQTSPLYCPYFTSIQIPWEKL